MASSVQVFCSFLKFLITVIIDKISQNWKFSTMGSPLHELIKIGSGKMSGYLQINFLVGFLWDCDKIMVFLESQESKLSFDICSFLVRQKMSVGELLISKSNTLKTWGGHSLLLPTVDNFLRLLFCHFIRKIESGHV